MINSDEEPIMTNQEAMDAIENLPEDSTCHSVGFWKFYAPGEIEPEPEDDKILLANIYKEAMEAITARELEAKDYYPAENDSTHDIAKDVLEEPKVEQETEFVHIFDGSLEKAIEGIRAFREQVAIEEKGLTSFQIKTLLEDTARNMRKVKEYCESTDYNTEVYEYHNSDCFYYELNEIHDMSDEIIQNFQKKSFTPI